MTNAEAKNLEAISRAIDQHNSNCPFPASEVRMNPFECERLGWEEIRGLPIVADPELGTGAFRIICSRDQEGEGIEEAEALGIPIEVAVPERPEWEKPAGRELVESGRQAAAMFSRERVVRSQLGEDRDHHAAQLVLAGWVLLAGQRRLQLLERLLGISLVPGRESLLKLVGAGSVR